MKQRNFNWGLAITILGCLIFWSLGFLGWWLHRPKVEEFVPAWTIDPGCINVSDDAGGITITDFDPNSIKYDNSTEGETLIMGWRKEAENE